MNRATKVPSELTAPFTSAISPTVRLASDTIVAPRTITVRSSTWNILPATVTLAAPTASICPVTAIS